jgi:hypothetical protein
MRMSSLPWRLRRHRRFSLEVSTDAEGTSLRDISMGGMRVLSRHALQIDQMVETGLETAHGVLHLRGRVVRACRSGVTNLPYEYGIELEGLKREDILCLQHFLDELSEQAAMAPEKPVDILDLQRLYDRIDELERALDAHSAAAAVQEGGHGTDRRAAQPSPRNLAGGPSDIAEEAAALQTSFDFTRFAHLVRLGQPLLNLAGEDREAIADEKLRTLAAALTPRFDLELSQSVDEVDGDELAHLTRLFALYERAIIDFA